MKRKLVNFEVFEKIRENSLSAIHNELIEAEEHLARTLDLDSLELESFDNDQVVYKKNDGSFVKASYVVESDHVTFDNIEELVIDTDSESEARKNVVKEFVNCLLEDKELEADKHFAKIMEMASQKYQREGTLIPEDINEASVRIYGTRGKGGTPRISVSRGTKNPKRSAAAKRAHRLHKSSYVKGAQKRKSQLSKERSRRKSYKASYGKLYALSGGKQYKRGRKHLNEWLTLTENVFEYIDVMENGNIIKESIVRNDQNGNIVSARIPTSRVRSEAKLIKHHHEKMNKKDSPKEIRESALRYSNENYFTKLVAEAKRYNNLSDNKALQESIESIVQKFPGVLYLTLSELAQVIGTSLENQNVVNYDDDLCTFLSEGILRTAHSVYSERVEKLHKLSNCPKSEDGDHFNEFVKAMDSYIPQLDEVAKSERAVFEQLYQAVEEVRVAALESNNEEIRNEANEIIRDLSLVLDGKANTEMEFALEVADWLRDVVEANLETTWNVEKKAYQTKDFGNHPRLNNLAKAGLPADYNSLYDGEPAPQRSLDKDGFVKVGDRRGLGDESGKTDMEFAHSHLPKDFEKVKVVDEDGLGDYEGETFPKLNNPFLPKSLVPKQLVDPDNGVD